MKRIKNGKIDSPISDENSIGDALDKAIVATKQKKRIAKRPSAKKSVNKLLNKERSFDVDNQTVILDKTDCAIVFKKDGQMKVFMAIRDNSDTFETNEELTMALASMCSHTSFTQNLLNAYRTILAKAIQLDREEQLEDE